MPCATDPRRPCPGTTTSRTSTTWSSTGSRPRSTTRELPPARRRSAQLDTHDTAIPDANNQAVRDRHIGFLIGNLFPVRSKGHAARVNEPAGLVVPARKFGQHQQLANPQLPILQFRAGDHHFGDVARVLPLRVAPPPFLRRFLGRLGAVVEGNDVLAKRYLGLLGMSNRRVR